MKRFILIDFENIQKIDFQFIDVVDTEVVIFVGKSQNKIPFSIVEKAQALGSSVKWIKIAGDGKNNLDFHIACELGRISERLQADVELIVLSKDNGYDSLIAYLSSSGIRVRRIANIAELSKGKVRLPSSEFTSNVVANLNKIGTSRRPRTRGTLKKHIESVLRDRANTNEIEAIIEEMFIKGLITQSNNRLRYNLSAS